MKTLTVYDTLTGKDIEIEVTDDFYDEYQRMNWLDDYYERKEKANTVLLCDLRDSDNNENEFGNICEFEDPTTDPADIIEKRDEMEQLRSAINQLSEKQFDLINSRYFLGFSAKEYGKKTGINQSSVTRKERRILKKLKFFLGRDALNVKKNSY